MTNLQRLAGIVMLTAIMPGSPRQLWADGLPTKSSAKDTAPLYVGLGGGYIRFEGDEATKSGGCIQLKLGYDYTPRWSLEGSLLVFPKLDKNDVMDYQPEPHPRPGLDGSSTWAAGLAADALFHLNGAEDRQWDPYLMGGVGATYYERDREDAWRVDPVIRYGIGLAYHFTPEWAVRVDVDGQTPIHKQRDVFEFNFIPSAGIAWSPAARKPARPSALAAGVTPAAVAAAAPAPQVAPTSPPAPDLQMFKLDMDSAEGKWHEYFSELDAIAKIVRKYPESVIVIEGNMDRQPNVSEREAQKLTEKKAEAIRDYFIQNHKIAKKRITAVGYGYSQSKPGAAASGAAESRRMLIHIRGAPANP
jgi:outer membrane protein OmpA-like peptidoglycan-associated protein